MAAPTVASAVFSAFNVTTSPKTISLTWAAGAFIVIYSIGSDGAVTFPVPTATGLTFAQVHTTGQAGASTRVSCFTATAAGAGSAVTVSQTNSGTTNNFGFMAWVVTNHNGVGNNAVSAAGGQAAGTISLTPQAANSAIFTGVGDWSAIATTSAVASPTGASIATSGQLATVYTWYGVQLLDSGAVAAKAMGITGPASTAWSVGALEVKGIAAATTVKRRPGKRTF